MRWGKFVLLFQAIITLLIGMVFMSQLFTISEIEVDSLKADLSSGEDIFNEQTNPVVSDLKQRYTVAAYILLIIAIIELLVISRLMS